MEDILGANCMKKKTISLKSNYLEDAKPIEIKLSIEKVYELPIEKFIEWVKTGNLSEDNLRKAIIAKDEQGNENIVSLLW